MIHTDPLLLYKGCYKGWISGIRTWNFPKNPGDSDFAWERPTQHLDLRRTNGTTPPWLRIISCHLANKPGWEISTSYI